MSKNLNDYVTLGRSGLRVSPLCLGTMTFGNEWGWGAEEQTARSVFDRYIDAGGNFIDTADGYTEGHSEELVGKSRAVTAERISTVRSKAHCEDCRLTTSIFTGCMPGTR